MEIEPGSTSADSPAFEVIDHTADWALRIFGRDMAGLLINAALGMSSLLVTDLATVPQDEERRLKLVAFDSETLLVDWLSELAYLAESEGLVFREYELSQVTETEMTAVVRGGRASELLKHIKAVTYHNLVIEHTDRGLEATVVFDV